MIKLDPEFLPSTGQRTESRCVCGNSRVRDHTCNEYLCQKSNLGSQLVYRTKLTVVGIRGGVVRLASVFVLWGLKLTMKPDH